LIDGSIDVMLLLLSSASADTGKNMIPISDKMSIDSMSKQHHRQRVSDDTTPIGTKYNALW
jgi:hypothetical protein